MLGPVSTFFSANSSQLACGPRGVINGLGFFFLPFFIDQSACRHHKGRHTCIRSFFIIKKNPPGGSAGLKKGAGWLDSGGGGVQGGSTFGSQVPPTPTETASQGCRPRCLPDGFFSFLSFFGITTPFLHWASPPLLEGMWRGRLIAWDQLPA